MVLQNIIGSLLNLVNNSNILGRVKAVFYKYLSDNYLYNIIDMPNSSDILFHYGEFLFSSIIYDYGLSLTTNLLNKYSPPFKTLEDSRKKYVATNINKSILLSLISGIFLKTVYSNPSLLKQNNDDISDYSKTIWKTTAVLYGSTDLVALIRDKTMSATTKTHHYAVLLSLLIVLASDFKKGSLAKAIVIYGGFSSLALMVNFYLGSRFLFKRNGTTIKYIKKFSFYSYLLACGLNWAWQGNYILHAYRGIFSNPMMLIKLALNITMLYSWIKDDTILMRHLSQ